MKYLAGLLLLGVAACTTGMDDTTVPGANPSPETAPAPAARAAPTTTNPTATSPHIVAAVENPARPDADREADARRKPAEMLAFAGVEPGMKVGDMISGGGYFTRLFSAAVGPEGHVYGLNGAPAAGRPAPLEAVLADSENFGNVSNITTDYVTIAVPEPLDVIWTSQNYHDVVNRAGENIGAVNAAVLGALKPGGVFIVLDHSAKADAPADVSSTLHRIKQSTVIEQVTAAGFEYVGEDMSVRNADDPRDKGVFDASIRGVTDQFVLKFRKPA